MASNPPVQLINGKHESKLEAVQHKYEEERQKRLRDEGLAQYSTLAMDDKLRHMSEDIWTDAKHAGMKLKSGTHHRLLIIGAGYGGLSFAYRFLDIGFQPADITFVDTAKGFGGTWYWNRYPGLMCDIESYIYLPYLEETGYMPRHKYSYGPELRQYADLLAEHRQLEDRALFGTAIRRMDWNESSHTWVLQVEQELSGGGVAVGEISVDFVAMTTGVLNRPKVASFQGFETFKGSSFHTSRWRYDVTGGSEHDQSLVNLTEKRVGIIGTGATAIQAVPELAKWSKQLFVFQRTPSSVNVRGQRETDPIWWAQETGDKKGWQDARRRNFGRFLNSDPVVPEVNMVNDEWTRAPGMAAICGTPKVVTLENMTDYVASLKATDLPYMEKVRARVDETVDDKEVAQKLKPWYNSWCKRPCFHDEYLSSFNKPNVTLVDTAGKAVDVINETGIVANGLQYDLDVIIFSTGYTIDGIDVPNKTIEVTGRTGKSMQQKWAEGMTTLHGVVSTEFPNLFFAFPRQSVFGPAYTQLTDLLSQQAATMVAHALAQNAGSTKVTIEPTGAAAEAWARRMASMAPASAPMAGCTPGYYNAEGLMDRLTPEQRMRVARSGSWTRGYDSFTDVIDEWNQKGIWSDLEVKAY